MRIPTKATTGIPRAVMSNLLLLTSTLLLLFPTTTTAKAILGIDLGSLYMKVALVQRNSPLEIVTNLHSKRKTEQMVMFDAGTRFYGADANSLYGRKPHLTPTAMSVMLGRGDDHPSVKVLTDRHYPITPTYNETRSGVCLTVNGREFTPEELVSMVLTHAKDITAAFGAGTEIKDCVLTVPSFYTQHERRALMDAAYLANLNVLSLIDENTAAALHFGIDRIDTEAKNILFYNMGASALQVSVVRYFSYERKESKLGKAKAVGAFQVLGKAWDATLGGLAFDGRLVNFMADEFNESWNKKRGDGETKDVRKYPRPMAKLRIQANKVKHVLSANTDLPIFIDALHDDTYYQSKLTRRQFEDMCKDLLDRSSQPIHDALKAANLTLDEIDQLELIGGGMRVPKVQEEILKALGGKLELGKHINSDESMALGAAFHGANVSTAFRVRHVGMSDINPFPISIGLTNLPEEEAKGGLFGIGGGKKKDEADAEDEEVWSKRATIFKSNGRVGVKKTIAFTHDKDVHCTVDYEEDDALPSGTELSIERYNITGVSKFASEMAEKGLGKPKMSLQFELDTSGLTRLVKAEAVVEEMVMVTEDVEVEIDEEEEEENGEKKEGDAAKEEDKEGAAEENKEEEKKEEEKKEESDDKDDKKENETKTEPEKKKKKKKIIQVEKEKKKLHKRTLEFKTYHDGLIRPHSPELMAESVEKLALLDRLDNERKMLEESRNKVESYIYHIKNKMSDEEEAINAVTTEEQRTAILEAASAAEDWMYDDGYNADLATMEDKYAELSVPAEKIFFRVSEAVKRPKAIEALKAKLKKVEDLMTKWETTMPQVTVEEREEVLKQVEVVKQWIEDKVSGQEKADPTSDEETAFVSADVPLQTKPIESKVAKLSKKPKPKPKPVEKNETDAEGNETKSEDGEKKEEKKEEEESDSEAKDENDDSEL